MRVSVGLDDLQANAAWVQRLAAYLVREGGEAEDLAQETFIAALRSPRPMHMPVTAWLAGILRNLSRVRARTNRRRQTLEQVAEQEKTIGAAPGSTPDELLERMELHQLLGGLVLELEEPYRSTVLLRYYEGLSAAEIATKSGIPAGTVRWRLKQGLDEVRRKLDDRWPSRKDWIAALAPLAAPGLAGYAAAPLVAATAGGFGLLAWSASGVILAAAVATAVRLRAISPDPSVDAAHEVTPPTETALTVTSEPYSTAAGEAVFDSLSTSSMSMSLGSTSGAIATTSGTPIGNAAQSSLSAIDFSNPSSGPLGTSAKHWRYIVPLGSGPFAGPSDAKITMLVFMGYECPFSAKGDAIISRILEKFPRDVRVQVIQAPLAEHANALPAAKAALAAGEQGKYWEMHHLLFANRETMPPSSREHLARRMGVSPTDIDGYARKLGLDMDRFHRDAASAAVENALAIDKESVESVGTPFGTPTFFINGRRVNGSLRNEIVEQIVEDELRTADRLLASGVPRDQIFREMMRQETAAPSRGSVGAAGSKLDLSLMDETSGIYVMSDGAKISIERDDDHLVLKRTRRLPTQLLAQSPSHFFFTDESYPGEVVGPFQVDVVRSGNGKITGIEVTSPEGTVDRASRLDSTSTSDKIAPLAPRLASVASDDFESGNLAAWRVDNDGAGSWYVYAHGKAAPSPIHSDPNVPFDMPAPPQGHFAAVTDMDGPGTLLLYRDLTLDGPYRMALQMFYATRGPFTRAAPLDRNWPGPNQQIRIDLIAPNAPLDSVAEEHVIANIFRTSPDDPTERPPTSLSSDLASWKGRTLRLRLAVVNNAGPIRLGVDDVRFERLGN